MNVLIVYQNVNCTLTHRYNHLYSMCAMSTKFCKMSHDNKHLSIRLVTIICYVVYCLYITLWPSKWVYYYSQTDRWQGSLTHPPATTTHAKTTVSAGMTKWVYILYNWNENYVTSKQVVESSMPAVSTTQLPHQLQICRQFYSLQL